MKEIELTKGAKAIVDDNLFVFLSLYKWHLLKGKYDRLGYAVRYVKLQGKQHTLFMHHVICPRIKGFEVDHVNRNSLDNRRQNLRYLTHKENCAHFKELYKGIKSNPYDKNPMKYRELHHVKN